MKLLAGLVPTKTRPSAMRGVPTCPGNVFDHASLNGRRKDPLACPSWVGPSWMPVAVLVGSSFAVYSLLELGGEVPAGVVTRTGTVPGVAVAGATASRTVSERTVTCCAGCPPKS